MTHTKEFNKTQHSVGAKDSHIESEIHSQSEDGGVRMGTTKLQGDKGSSGRTCEEWLKS